MASHDARFPTKTERNIMAEIPWMAWIAIVAIVMWGVITVVNTIAQRPRANDTSVADSEEIERLKRRVDELEDRLNRRD